MSVSNGPPIVRLETNADGHADVTIHGRRQFVGPAESYCFSPRKASEDNRLNVEATRPGRKTKRYPCEAARIEREKIERRKRGGKERLPGDRYTTNSHSAAIRKA